ADLRVQFLDFGVRGLSDIGFVLKHCGKVVDSLFLPGIDHRLMHAVLGAELRDRQLAPDRLESYFRFEFSAVTIALRLCHLYSSFPKDEPSLINCPIRGDPLSLMKNSVYLPRHLQH